MKKIGVAYAEYSSGIVVQGYERLKLLIREFARGDMVLRMAESHIDSCREHIGKPRPEKDLSVIEGYDDFESWFAIKMSPVQ